MQTIQQLKDCSIFLGELTQLGASLGNLRTVEEAYWELLKQPGSTVYDEDSPFRLNGTPDIHRVAPMLRDLGANTICQEADDNFWELAWWAGGNGSQSDQADDARIKARQMSVASLWCVAVVFTLALKAGVYESNKKKLVSLIVEASRG